MRALVQRVSRGRVSVEGQVLGEIGRGLVILLGVGQGDSSSQAAYLAHKIAHLRIFQDAQGKMNCSLTEVGGQALVISQFTLYGNTHKGRRPSFVKAAPPDVAAPLVDQFADYLRAEGVLTQAGRFGAHMLVEIDNDGPVTLWLERQA